MEGLARLQFEFERSLLAIDRVAARRALDAIAKAGPGGGFMLSDHHGEVPWQVPEEVLLSISEAVHKRGNYALDWVVEEHG